MALNPNQFHKATPSQKSSGVPIKKWMATEVISASDALEMVTAEQPRNITEGKMARTDWEKQTSQDFDNRDFVQYKHSPHLLDIKYQRAKWGEPDSLYRHIQKHGLDKSNAVWAMRNPSKPDQVLLTEGHHRIAAAHAIDPDMPIHVIDEGIHHSGAHIKDRFKTYDNNLKTTEKHLQQFLKNPNIMAEQLPERGLTSKQMELRDVQRTINRYSLDPSNIAPTEPDKYVWRDYGMHKEG
jgi:hypothetical protein